MQLKTCWLLLGLFALGLAQAENYPSRAVQVVTPFPPGGAADVVVRLVTQQLSDLFKVPFVVDNKPGAGGGIGAQFVSHAMPDGYTLLLTSSSTMSINPHLNTKMGFDPLKSLSPIAFIGDSPNVLVVSPSLPFKTSAELIAAAKAKPGFYSFASNGSGTLSHLTGELYKQASGIDALHVPYKGASPAVVDVAGGQVSFLFAAFASVGPMVKSGKLRALGVTSTRRLNISPELPTLAESGLSGFESNQWWGLFAPLELPHEVLARLNLEMNKALKSPDLKKRFAEQGIEVGGGSPADLAAYLQNDYNKWGQIIKTGNIAIN
jgi:tripartite-type tricarboxylate transporter receptor subunit TctC